VNQEEDQVSESTKKGQAKPPDAPPADNQAGPETISQQSLTAAYETGFREGYEQAKAELGTSARPTLFDAARAVCQRDFPMTDDLLAARITALEEEYGEQLSKPDRELLLAGARRLRLRAGSDRVEPTVTHRPSRGGRTHVETGDVLVQ
jgi:hypothetical protein